MKIYEESARCLLCGNAKCTSACPSGFDPSAMVRAVRFENEFCAPSFIEKDVCAKCEGFCEKNCIHYDFPVRIRKIAEIRSFYHPPLLPETTKCARVLSKWAGQARFIKRWDL